MDRLLQLNTQNQMHKTQVDKKIKGSPSFSAESQVFENTQDPYWPLGTN